jgi:hypothetical protein
MGWIIRAALLVGGALAALLMGREAEGFPVLQGMLALAAIAAVVVLGALLRR